MPWCTFRSGENLTVRGHWWRRGVNWFENLKSCSFLLCMEINKKWYCIISLCYHFWSYAIIISVSPSCRSSSIWSVQSFVNSRKGQTSTWLVSKSHQCFNNKCSSYIQNQMTFFRCNDSHITKLNYTNDMITTICCHP